jgi:hypothetical protein
MYKEITRADAVDGSIYLRAVSFATQMLYRIISDDNLFKDFVAVKDNRVAFEILCSDFSIITFETMGMREYIYTDEQGIYICTFAATTIFPVFWDTASFEKVKKDRKTILKDEWKFSALFGGTIFKCLQEFDKNHTEKYGKIREDVPLRAEVE